MKYLAKTLYGLETVLSAELQRIGATGIQVLNRAVAFNGDKEILYKANYCSRTALSILKPIADFRIRSVDDFYRSALKVPWGDFLDLGQTFSVVPVIKSPVFRHSGYPALVLKDAVADWFRESKGRRPFVDTANPDIVINLHISNDQADISLDSSVVPLFKRGYRKIQGEAPMNETLAAGIILLSGWDGKSGLIDPMCGSGTIPIEAAMIASNTPPGSFRSFWGFQNWSDYDVDLFGKVKKESLSKITQPAVKIYASDKSQEAVAQTRINAESASVAEYIIIENRDFSELDVKEPQGWLIINPPYGQRIKHSDTDSLYSMIGSILKHNFSGYKAFIITSEKQFINQIGLKPSEKRILYNGSILCTLLKYELYEGSRKEHIGGVSDAQ